MEYIKKLHETVEILEILWTNCLNCLKNLMQIFTSLFRYSGIPLYRYTAIPYQIASNR